MTMTDKVLAVLSFVGLTIFTGIVVVFVRELDLAVVVLMCIAIGMYDFWTTLRAKDNANNNANTKP